MAVRSTTSDLPEQIECVVLGAGHAGLAVSYELVQRSVPHIILERGQIAETWRSKRWDEFVMIMPNWGLDLPGFPYGGDRDAFTNRDEFVTHLERYAASFNAPLRLGVTVDTIGPAPDSDADTSYPFIVDTDHGRINASSVIVATGIYQVPRIPQWADDIPNEIVQMTPDTYRSSDHLTGGTILVVGSGASGTQIAEDLQISGSSVILSLGRAGRMPRRYRGIDTSRWARYPGIKQSEGDRDAAAGGQAHRTGRGGGDHDINLHRFARDGITLIGHITGVSPDDPWTLCVALDMHESLRYTDDFDDRWRAGVDAYVARTGMDVPPAMPRPDDGLTDGFLQPERDRLDLRAEGISTVIWAIGYDQDYSVVHFPFIGADGHPIHEGGVTSIPGLYVAGMTWRGDGPKSSFIGVVGPEAAAIAAHVAARI